MLYVLFLILALGYNWRKFAKERTAFLKSLIEATNVSHREMILSHFFHVFILEVFLALIVAHVISERAFSIGMLGLGFFYLFLLFTGVFFYQFFIRHLEKATGLALIHSFRKHVVQEVRVSFALIMLPILIYSSINWAFQDGVYEEWGNLWFIGLIFNILFVSVLTIVCTVIIMLRLIPNREISEPEYVGIINKRLGQIGMPNMRVRWIETDVKNAFVVGLKLLSFSNQTMFVGKRLRDMLTTEEFDAVICHELSHVANRHVHKRVIDLMKNFLSIIMGCGLLSLLTLGFSILYWGEDISLHSGSSSSITLMLCFGWIVFNYTLLFDTIRAHEFESDAYAVMKLGANYESLKSALEKLTQPEELPEYLLSKQKKDSKLDSWFKKNFSTHPDVETRINQLKFKIDFDLPFNHYVSSAQKLRSKIGQLFNWKISLPVSICIALFVFGMVRDFKSGQKAIALLNSASPQEILKSDILIEKINKRPSLVGHTLMFYVVKRKDVQLIDFFVAKGADKGRTLLYISQLKDVELFQKYFNEFKPELSEDDYFLVLRKTAQLNFTEGYRSLVNSERFESLNPSYKDELSRFHQRRPASTKHP